MRIQLAFLSAAAALVLSLSACSSTSDTEACGPSNCDGCCTLEGACMAGDEQTACGTAGGACSVCIASQVCATGECALPVADIDGGTMTGDGGTDVDGGMDMDAGMDADAGMDVDGGMPPQGAIVAPAETWTWVDFPDAVCGNGSATGIGVNLTAQSTDVFVYMEGGGACWDGFTCFTLQTASNLHSGYGSQQFNNAPYRSAFAVDRDQAANPFRDMSYVYIPYCTGDVHAGDALQTYGSNPPVHHKGAKNVEAYLARLVATFPNATRIFLTGSSAGGFGAQLNYERFAEAFPNAEVHVLADSAQMITPSNDRLADWLAAWNFTLPAACANCTTDFTLFPEYLNSTYPDRRFALTAYTQDTTLRNFFGYSATDYEAATRALLTNRYDPYANGHYFLLAGSNHTMLGSLGTLTAPSGKTLNSWVTEWVEGDPNWASLQP